VLPSSPEPLQRRLQEIRQQVRRAGGVRAWLFHLPGPGPRLMSRLRSVVVVARNPKASITFGAGVYLGPGFSVDAPKGGTFTAAAGSEFRRDFRAELGSGSARIEIGARSVFTNDVLIQCASAVSIGSDCQVDQASLLVDGDRRLRERAGGAGAEREPRPLTIGDHVTITTKCTVIADVGSHSMVGANSVVLQPLPPHSLAAGSPAQVIGYFGPTSA
jgi:acetyltransferase-like isoleucine patch superfamily enzyme